MGLEKRKKKGRSSHKKLIIGQTTPQETNEPQENIKSDISLWDMYIVQNSANVNKHTSIKKVVDE